MSESAFRHSLDEARARIIWGESPAEVQHWLVTEEGLTEQQAKVIIDDIRRQRATEVRRSGLRSARAGAGLFLGGLGSWAAIGFLPWIPAILLVGSLCLMVYGLYKIVSGLLRTLSGQARGSLTEME